MKFIKFGAALLLALRCAASESLVGLTLEEEPPGFTLAPPDERTIYYRDGIVIEGAPPIPEVGTAGSAVLLFIAACYFRKRK